MEVIKCVGGGGGRSGGGRRFLSDCNRQNRQNDRQLLELQMFVCHLFTPFLIIKPAPPPPPRPPKGALVRSHGGQPSTDPPSLDSRGMVVATEPPDQQEVAQALNTTTFLDPEGPPRGAASRSTKRSTHARPGMHMQQCSAVPLI